ncbi:MAG: response regulator transcription factor [Anaerolineales bacterium]|nr:response regulator transcription factor [Anaerolineales bacterium]
MSEQVIRILVVEDHDVVRRSVVALLGRQADMEVVGTATNGREAIELAQALEPDVIIMDVSMPELDGIRAAGKIQALNIPSRIIMLSMHYNSTLVQQARKHGACAYLSKQRASRDLIPAIRAASTGMLSL